MIWFGLILILVGVINIISAKKKIYWGLNDHFWNKLYGESFTRAAHFISGIMLIIIGIFIMSSLWS